VRRLLAVPCLVWASGCGTFTASLAYSSGHQVERAPLNVDVKVNVLPIVSVDDDDFLSDLRAGDEPQLAQSLRAAFRTDLQSNGPFVVDARAPDAILELTVAAIAVGDTTFWATAFPWTWSFIGLPTYSRKLALTVDAKVVAPNGKVLDQLSARADCKKWSGLFYGWSITMACAAEDAMEQLRDELAERRQSLVAAAARERSAPVLAAAPALVPPPPAPAVVAGPAGVIAVFDLEDPSSKLSLGVADQLTAYLASKLAERGFRVVPRDQLRARLLEEKAESYKTCYDTACQIELGKALAAEKSLSTRLLQFGATCAMTSTLYDLKSETTERAATVKTGCGEDALLTSVDALVDQLRGR
jgi:hypothetical protein